MAALVINTNIINNYDGYLVDANAVKGGYIAVAGVWKRVLKSYIKNDDWAESKASDTFNDYELFVKAVQ